MSNNQSNFSAIHKSMSRFCCQDISVIYKMKVKEEQDKTFTNIIGKFASELFTNLSNSDRAMISRKFGYSYLEPINNQFTI